jgi:outer membrane protein assembly factor BamB
LDNFATASPILSNNGILYAVTTSPGILYAMDASSGVVRWQYSLGYTSITSSPALDLSSGNIYVGTQAPFYSVYAISSAGALIWTFTTSGYIVSAIAVGGDGTVYFGSTDSNVYAVNPTGTLKWKLSLGANVMSPVSIGPDGTIFVGTYGGNLVAINPSGSLRWSTKIFVSGNGYIYNSSPVINGTNYVTITGQNTTTNQGVITSVRYSTGVIFWSKLYSTRLGSLAFDSSQNIYYVPGTPIRAIDQSGNLIRSYTDISNSAVLPITLDASSNMYLYYGGILSVFNSSTAVRTSSFTIANSTAAGTPIIGVDGTVYICTNTLNTNLVYAL